MSMTKEETLARLRQRKKILKFSLTQLEKFFKDLDIDDFDVDEVKVRIERAEETSKELIEILLEIGVLDEELSEGDLDREIEESENKLFYVKVMEEKLVNSRVELDGSKEGLEQAFGNTEANEINAQRGMQVPNEARNCANFIRLPKIELPTFSGLYEEWYVFYDVFKSLIHSNLSLNDVQRFHYLKSALKGEAAECISSLKISGANYANAWTRLQERYDNQRLIIQTHINAIFDLPAVKKENGIAIRQVLDGVLKHTRALQALKRPTPQWDDLLIHIVTSKLDIVTIKEWENTLKPTVMPSFEELTAFLTKRCQTLEMVANQQQQFSVSTNSRKVGHNKITAAHVTTTNIKCLYCNGDHLIYQCKAFQKLSVSERTSQVKQKGLCLNCLRPKHLAKDCIADNCKICGKKHSSLLHFENNKDKESKEKQSNPKQDSNENKENTGSVSCHYTNLEENVISKQVLLSTAIVKVKNKDGQFVEGRALLDNGSQSNFISERFMNMLGLKCSKTQIKINGINQQVSHALKIVNLHVKSRFDSFSMDIKCIVLPCITRDLPAITIGSNELEIPSNIRLADPKFQISRGIDLLIGAEKFWDLVCVGQIKLGKNKPTLQKSTLGWLIAGVIKRQGDKVLHTSCHLSIEESLSNTLNKFWQVEDCFNQENLTEEERYVEEYFKNNHTRDADGRFVVKLPLNQAVINQLGTSKDIAMKRLLSIERKFKREPELKIEYANFMNEYLQLGHMKPVTEQMLSKRQIFLPHQAVIRKDSVTTKTRVVFDASSKDSKGFSLNDALYKGPVIQSDLFSIIMRFRFHRYVICSDIRMMYRQIRVDKDHTSLQTILWRENPAKQVQIFKLLTLTYGTKPASYLATKCLHQLAELEKKNFPKASKVVLTDFYMDDLLTGSDTIQELTELKSQINELLQLGGFELHKWKSNTHLDSIAKTNTKGCSIEFCKDQDSKLLGILWDPNEDVLYYKSPVAKLENRVTKRIMLAEISKLFDPLGLVGPIITAAKILIQSLWACNIDWDNSVPMNINKSWKQIKSQLHLLKFIKVPRLVISANEFNLGMQLHGFCDASEQAYGACIYVRGHDASTALLCSKSRIAPLKTISLPRLELCGAVLLIKLMKKVVSCLGERECKRYYWTDSKIVLAWLNSPARRWKTFVSNRISVIQSNSAPSEWYHVKSKDNPADLISRGATPEKLKGAKLWWKGPLWLSEEETKWPSENAKLLGDNVELGERCEIVVANVSIQDYVIQYERYSSLERLLRVIAYVLRFGYNSRCEVKDRIKSEVTTQEIEKARLILIKIVQANEFENEIKCLKSKKNVSKSSRLVSLNPYLDSSDILRVGGRLENSKLPEATKHPIILPSVHHVTKLIIKEKHERSFHAGTQATLAFLREEYWPLAARSEVKKITRTCVKCIKASPTPCQQIMGQLPCARVNPSRPFYNAGVDYCGPFFVRDRVRRNSKKFKAYVAVFVCMATKAMHLELVEDLTSEAFIGALKRFISRRGRVMNMYSDNGKNFLGADNELKELLQNAEFNDKLQQAAVKERLIWHFIPPRSPHFGGLWESAVRSMKQHLKKTIGEASLTITEMMTVLSQIEAILNSRPLMPLSDDPTDLNALTPAYFLIGKSLTSYPEPNLQDTPINRLSRWQHVERLKQHFWSRWSKEYLSTCQERAKWKTQTHVALKIGQLVILKEDESIPFKWTLARIIDVHPGQDGVIRTVTVRTSNGTYKRPIVKICPIPTEENEEGKTM